MKIYEIKGWNDGGPNDKGYLKGYVRANSKEEANTKAGVTDGWTSVHEISEDVFKERKKQAEEEYNMYFV